jgi:phosphoadenosine phosphosulfate reductase
MAIIDGLNAQFENSDPPEIISWTIDTFGPGTILSCGPGRETGILLYMISRMGMQKSLRMITLDTGMLFPEDHHLMNEYRTRYGLIIEALKPETEKLVTLPTPSIELFSENDDLSWHCCKVRKKIPLAKALVGCPAWISGLRQDESLEDREDVPLFQIDGEHAKIFKVSPLAHWSDDMVLNYIHDHDIPYHALFDRGYGSIGCKDPCTVPGKGRKGRFPWRPGKKFCGIHEKK